MKTVDIIVAAYLFGIIAILCLGSIFAYRAQVKRGEIIDESENE